MRGENMNGEGRKYTYSGSGVDVLRNDEFTDYIKSIVKIRNGWLKNLQDTLRF